MRRARHVVAAEAADHVVEGRQRPAQAGEGDAGVGMAVDDRAGIGQALINRRMHGPFAGRVQGAGMAAIEARRNHRIARELLGRHAGRGDQHAGAEADADIAGGADIESPRPSSR